jgi:ABC-type antimicrobial peptide transport system permease subunit
VVLPPRWALLLAAVGFVLLITCANTASLFLSRIAIRQREMAIRTAIGASRGRLIREMVTESLLLAGCGGALGVLIASWGVDAIVAAAPPDLSFAATSPIEIDTRILVVAAAMTFLTGVVFGLLPALRGSRPHLDVILKGTSGGGGSASYSRFGGGLIVAEVAFSLILLVAAALMMRTLANLGARQADVLRLVLSRGLALTLGGTALGLIGAFALTRFLETLLFQVRPVDPTSFAAVTIVMIAVALLACWLPARRAMRVDPADALRVE